MNYVWSDRQKWMRTSHFNKKAVWYNAQRFIKENSMSTPPFCWNDESLLMMWQVICKLVMALHLKSSVPGLVYMKSAKQLTKDHKHNSLIICKLSLGWKEKKKLKLKPGFTTSNQKVNSRVWNKNVVIYQLKENSEFKFD